MRTPKQLVLLMIPLLLMTCRNVPEGESMQTSNSTTNRLIKSTSPYLLQHAHNPVDWYPWGDEAFSRAQAEDKPIFLSIGYSTCHWCHVMAHECFEDAEVAALINEYFICIKVDREERPDIDQLYMSAATTMIGRGGWPLTIIMGPDKRPFFAGTYFPKHSSPGRVGLMDLLPRIQTAWVDQRSEIEDSADQILNALNQQTPAEPGPALNADVLVKAAVEFKSQYDARKGGFGGAPKFPSPHNLVFLLREGYRQGDTDLTKMALNTLKEMRYGGLFDQVGYGFHRYSTDTNWHLPHFEKMLYDQATLMMAYTEAWEIEKDPLFRETVHEIYTYLMDKLAHVQGAFYAAEDADSDGVEGKFYVWSHPELSDILNAEEMDLIESHFQVKTSGNFVDEASGQPGSENIFHLNGSESYTHSQADPVWESVRQQLYAHREERVKPGLDTKILCDWNGLVLTALSRAARIFQSEEYLNSARSLAKYLTHEMQDPELGLIHVRSSAHEKVSGFVDDYSFFIQGLRNLYEATAEVSYLTLALDLQKAQISGFWDRESGGFYFTEAGQEELFLRQKEIYDGAIPSGNSIAAENLYYLGRISENQDWEAMSRKLGMTFAPQVIRAPRGFASLLQTVQPQVVGSREIVIAGSMEAYTSALEILANTYDPFRLLVHNPLQGGAEIRAIAPFLEYQKAIDGDVTVYICENYTCQTPLKGLDELLKIVNP